MNHTPEEIGAKMDALGLWETIASFNWAIRPRGTVLPYFCTVLKGEKEPVKARFLLLEGWQTLHDFVLSRADRNYGYVTSPIELPHFELIVLSTGESKLFRHDVGYLPREANDRERTFAARLLWEAYGVMLRIETDRSLVYRYAEERAMFARVEGADGAWRDEPLAIPPPQTPAEKVSLDRADVKRAQDLPFVAEAKLDVDFRLMPNLATREPRPRTVYALLAVDPVTGAKVVDSRVSIGPDGGLKQLWELMPAQFVRELVRLGSVPGEIRLVSGRVFRLMRPLCLEFPVKISLHDRLDSLAALSAKVP